MTESAPASTQDYAALFQDHIGRSIARCMAAAAGQDKLPAVRDREQALLTLSYAMKLEQTWPAAGRLLLALAPAMERAGHRDDWMPYLEEGIEISQRLGDAHSEAELRWHLGVILERRGRYEAARSQLVASAAQFAALDDRRSQAKALNRLAFVACLQRQSEEASRLAAISSHLLPVDDVEHGYCDFVWGQVALDGRDWQAAHHHFSLALACWRAGDDRRMIAWGLTNLGIAMRRLNDPDGARACFHEAIALFAEVEDPVHEATAHMNLGNVYLTTGDPRQALQHYLAAEPVYQLVQGTLRLATVYLNIGMAYRRLQQWSDAQRTLQASIALFEQLQLPASVANVSDELALTYQDQGLLEQAIVAFEKALACLAAEPADTAQMQSITEHLHAARAAAAQLAAPGMNRE